ncbi:MAG: NAD(P)/FAD-dependent oxidoreductase, partial [Sphingobacterium siyangense]
MERKKVVIVGNGMVGNKFCEKLKQKINDLEIIVFSEEPIRAYDRVHLTDYFKISSIDELFLLKNEWYLENNVKIHLDDPIVAVNLLKKEVESQKGITVNYDYLVFATGSAPFVPPIPGIEKEGVFLYRTIEDLDLIKAYAAKAKRGTVMGGGLLGLEAAKAMVDLGLEETAVIEFAQRLMPRQIDDSASMLLQNKLSELGLTCLLQKSTSQLLGDDRLTGIAFQ